jgi:hypothetical protein
MDPHVVVTGTPSANRKTASRIHVVESRRPLYIEDIPIARCGRGDCARNKRDICSRRLSVGAETADGSGVIDLLGSTTNVLLRRPFTLLVSTSKLSSRVGQRREDRNCTLCHPRSISRSRTAGFATSSISHQHYTSLDGSSVLERVAFT